MAYRFEQTMDGMGASDEEAPPTNVRKKDLTKSQRLEAISILRVKYINRNLSKSKGWTLLGYTSSEWMKTRVNNQTKITDNEKLTNAW